MKIQFLLLYLSFIYLCDVSIRLGSSQSGGHNSTLQPVWGASTVLISVPEQRECIDVHALALIYAPNIKTGKMTCFNAPPCPRVLQPHHDETLGGRAGGAERQQRQANGGSSRVHRQCQAVETAAGCLPGGGREVTQKGEASFLWRASQIVILK